MDFVPPRAGYTLPVFACAAAIAALRHLHESKAFETVSLDLIEPPQWIEIQIEQVAKLKENVALAITRSDPGDNLDITKNTPIWAVVELETNENLEEDETIIIKGGEGIGRQVNAEGKAAIYGYAQRLLRENLQRLLEQNEQIKVTIILPKGQQLAQRTSNAAFGVIEGLSLLGTTGISQPLSAPGQLEIYKKELEEKAKQFDSLVFCVGENGLDLAQKLGINSLQLVKTANWLGSMLVAAGLYKVPAILLFGYHGKLIKLAGGIFHTHHVLADARLEILTAYCAQLGLPTSKLQEILKSETTEAALQLLRHWDAEGGTEYVKAVYGAIASRIDERATAYISKHSGQAVTVGSVLFGRKGDRQIIVKSPNGTTLLSKLC